MAAISKYDVILFRFCIKMHYPVLIHINVFKSQDKQGLNLSWLSATIACSIRDEPKNRGHENQRNYAQHLVRI